MEEVGGAFAMDLRAEAGRKMEDWRRGHHSTSPLRAKGIGALGGSARPRANCVACMAKSSGILSAAEHTCSTGKSFSVPMSAAARYNRASPTKSRPVYSQSFAQPSVMVERLPRDSPQNRTAEHLALATPELLKKTALAASEFKRLHEAEYLHSLESVQQREELGRVMMRNEELERAVESFQQQLVSMDDEKRMVEGKLALAEREMHGAR
eukprot:449848-Rhodomonas_salina.2